MSAPPITKESYPKGINGPSANRKPRRRDESTIHETLQNILANEVTLTHGHGHAFFNLPLFKSFFLYIELVFTEVYRYLEWVVVTWWAASLRTVSFLLSSHKRHPPGSEKSETNHVGDWLSYMFFALGGTLVLPFVLLLCLAARFPLLTRIYYYWSSLFGGNLGLVNSGNPNLFKALTIKQARAAKTELAKQLDETIDTDNLRHFNYDISKLLLQIAAVIYEHDNDAIRKAAFGSSKSTSPEDFKYLEATGDISIHRFCRQFGIEYHPVSELNDKSTAFCGVFWDPHSSWIVVALKGTGPIEFGEWLSDLDARMVPCGEYIRRFSLVHKGFKDRVFPETLAGKEDRRPYNTISQSVKALVNHLQPNLEAGEKVNVWFTGHSLGCATASLIYARMLMKPEEIGDNAILRDAYLFAAPILCDYNSVKVFNDKMLAEGAPRRTMWRITSNNDFVATGLPEYGDHLRILDPKAVDEPTTNNLLFAHLGTEIVLYDYPHSSSVTGNHIKHDVEVKFHSNHFTREQIAAYHMKQRSKLGEMIREKIGVVLQQIPLIGRFVAHGTVYYWDQLDRAAMGDLDWTVY